MLSMSTRNTDNKFDKTHQHLSDLTSKIGIDKVSDLLYTLSQDSDVASYGATVKLLASKYFLIPIEEISSGSSHEHSQIRGVCFHILHKSGASMRVIGKLFDRSENAVHRQVNAMEEVLLNPKMNKHFAVAYAEINNQFIRLKAERTEYAKVYPVVDSPSIEDQLREKIKEEIYKSGIKANKMALMIPMPVTCLYEFLRGKRSIKTKYIQNIQKYLNIKIV